MVVLMTALVAVSGSRATLDQQYYTRLAKEAAESGLVFAKECLRASNMVATWTQAAPLRPNTDCNGVVDSGKESHITLGSNLRSTFEIAISGSTELSYTVRAVGTTELLRSANGRSYKSFSETLIGNTQNILSTATSVASGRYQVCAVLSQTTWCNGGNEQGQMGNGRVDPLTDKVYIYPEQVLREDGVLAGKQDKIVGSGTGRACTVTTDNEVFCWGSSGWGSLGVGYNPINPHPAPIRVAKPVAMSGEITGIAMGWHATCVISSGDLWCWGRNNHGQLGDGTTVNHRLSPIRVPSIGAHVGMPVTDVHSQIYADSFCAVAGGEAYCWGRNNFGQLGDGTTISRNQPQQVIQQTGRLSGKSVSRVITVYAPRAIDGSVSSDGLGSECATYDRGCYSSAYSCTLTTDGEMYCWGSNAYGQMGQGNLSVHEQLTPVRVTGALDGKVVKSIAGSYRTPCALTTEPNDGDRLYCWGGNQAGAGGLGHTSSCWDSSAWRLSLCSPTPVLMQSNGLANKQIDSIDAGVNRMCAISEGSHYCTGLNTHGQVGDGTRINRSVMTEATSFKQYKPMLIY